MDDIDFLEHGGASDVAPCSVRLAGYDWPLDDPREKHYQWVLMALALQHLPSIPQDIPLWQHAVVFERWRAAWDLPDFQSARRLAYLVDKYRSVIASDLATHAHVDLGALWRARRWVYLLDLIDHLPAHSWYAGTVSMDEDHAKMMADAMIARRNADADSNMLESKNPSLIGWSPEVAALTNVLDAVRGVQHAVIAVQAGNKAPEPPKPAPRPVTPLERAMKRADFEQRKAKHEALAARVLPHKRKS